MLEQEFIDYAFQVQSNVYILIGCLILVAIGMLLSLISLNSLSKKTTNINWLLTQLKFMKLNKIKEADTIRQDLYRLDNDK